MHTTDKVHFYCDPGYLLIGNPEMNCSMSQSSLPYPVCRKLAVSDRRCPPLDKPKYGNVSVYREKESLPLHALYTCDRGFELSQSRSTCVNGTWRPSPPDHCKDIDECASEYSLCKLYSRVQRINISCINTPGSYTCTCPNGYRSTTSFGSRCKDIDECTDSTVKNTCQPPSQCVNTKGSYRCDRPTGGHQMGDNLARNTDCYGLPSLPYKSKTMHRFRSSNQSYFTNGTQVTIGCKPGYRALVQHRAVSVCVTGSWTNVSLQCRPYLCQPACHPKGGICLANNTCKCKDGWHGHRCGCTISCLNGGFCSASRPNKCICTSGFRGRNCEKRKLE